MLERLIIRLILRFAPVSTLTLSSDETLAVLTRRIERLESHSRDHDHRLTAVAARIIPPYVPFG